MGGPLDEARHWISGATGFVGSHLVYWALKRSNAQIIALVRPTTGEDAHERLMAVLDDVAASYREAFDRERAAKRIHVVHGDITQDGCGVDVHKLPATLRTGVHMFWHVAASLNFEDKYEAQIRLQNVHGTKQALALAEQLDVGRFVYVSTAYSCGKWQGDVPETLHALDREFNNIYERTKCEAEHEVARWSEASGRPVAIVRPSIVVGPKSTHMPGGSDTGLYGFTREVYRLRRTLLAAGKSLLMCGDRDAKLNLVAVDDVVSELWRLARNDFAGGLVHHVTSAEQPSVEQVLGLVGEVCGVGAIRVASHRPTQPSPVEQAIDRRAAFYSSYLKGDKHFVRRAGPSMSISHDDVEHYVRGYLRNRRSETALATFKRELVKAADGSALSGYSTGAANGPTLILCNAYGVPADVWVPLANALSPDFRLITWEQRESDGSEGATITPDVHVSDLRRVMNHYGIAHAYLVGWCTGADVALRFAERYPARVSGVVSIGGALNGACASETPFQRNLRNLVHKAAHDLRHAQLYHQILFGQDKPHYGTLAGTSHDGDRSMLSSMLGALDPALLHLTSAPFRDAGSLHRYARTMSEHYRHAETHGLPDVQSRVLLITGTADEVAHPEASRVAARALVSSTLVELTEGDHFALFTDARVGQSIREFISAGHPRRSRSLDDSAAA